MSDRGDYHELAAQCLRQAQATSAPETKAILLMLAQAWMNLADRHEHMKSLVLKTEAHAGKNGEPTEGESDIG